MDGGSPPPLRPPPVSHYGSGIQVVACPCNVPICFAADPEGTQTKAPIEGRKSGGACQRNARNSMNADGVLEAERDYDEARAPCMQQ